ncbi:MAG: hypothetical protein PHP52_04065 [Bacteroidales bacterium]|nr:hypothetical protein [Bacteroidales bacterium]MDD4216680.1 hypothetical protein [Bacteroidales bacterium]MDY0141618.1 hypothetical protein [Bacteroidales bacterium]
MLLLILSILSSATIFVIFKFIDKYKLPLINVIIINYIIAASLGFIINGNFSVNKIIHSNWILPAIIIGIIFIVLFFIVGKSSQKAGISITTVASKMSVVIPMMFAIIAYNESAGLLKISAIIMAVVAVAFSVYVKPIKSKKTSSLAVILPIILFIGMGINNSLLIYSKENYVNAEMSSIFTSTTFAIALLAGLLIILVRPSTIKGFGKLKTWILGLLLGTANFGSVYFIFLALNLGLFPNSITYGIVDVGIVILTVLIGTLFFKENLSKLNIFGISLSIVTIILMTIA